MSVLALTVDLSSRKLSSSIDSPFILGDQLRVSLSFTRKRDGADAPVDLPIRVLRASLGKTLAPPDAGKFSLASENIATDPVALDDLDFATTAADFLAAIAALDWVTAVEKPADGTWLLITSIAEDDPAPAEITVTANQLTPASFIRIRPFQLAGFWRVEIRLIQTPLAFTSSWERVLPAAPSVSRVHAGGSDPGDDVVINEVQALLVPADFKGLFTLSFDLRKTRVLGLQDGPDEIAAALNAMFTDGKTRFACTLPEDNTLHIEFIGPLEDEAQNLITTTVVSFPPGPPTFTLDLATAELASALRNIATLSLPFEVEADVVEEGEDPDDLDNEARTITIFQTTVQTVREQIWPEIADVPAIDWLRPPTPRDYIPFTADQVLTGQQQAYPATIGNGVLTSFTIAHNLDSATVQVIVVDIATKRLLRDNEYTVILDNANSLTLSGFASTPTASQYSVLVIGVGPASVFQAHTHTIAQIVGLQDALDLLGARLDTIEVLLPDVPPTEAAAGESGALEIPLKTAAGVVPGTWPAVFDATAAATSGTGLPSRGRGLLPAIHDVTVAAVSGILPLPAASGHAGAVFLNDSGSALALPGGLGRRSSSVAAGGWLGSDGRVWYALSRDSVPADTRSYFPADFERELFKLSVSSKMLRAGQVLDLEFDLALAMLRADTSAQWLLVIEAGIATEAVSPGIAVTGVAATNVLSAIAHGLADGTPVQFTAITGGAGLVITTTYFVRDAAADTFKLAATAGGSAIDFTTDISAGSVRITTGENLGDLAWLATPLLSQRLILTSQQVKSRFGVRISRDEVGDLSASQLLYGRYEAAGAVPSAPDFTLRARLIQFDTQDSVPLARGFVFYKFDNAEANIS